MLFAVEICLKINTWKKAWYVDRIRMTKYWKVKLEAERGEGWEGEREEREKMDAGMNVGLVRPTTLSLKFWRDQENNVTVVQVRSVQLTRYLILNFKGLLKNIFR